MLLVTYVMQRGVQCNFKPTPRLGKSSQRRTCRRRGGGRSEKEGCRAKNVATRVGWSHRSIGDKSVGDAGQLKRWAMSSSASAQWGQVPLGAWPILQAKARRRHEWPDLNCARIALKGLRVASDGWMIGGGRPRMGLGFRLCMKRVTARVCMLLLMV